MRPGAPSPATTASKQVEHVSHIFDKLGAANRTEALARARKLGLIPPT